MANIELTWDNHSHLPVLHPQEYKTWLNIKSRCHNPNADGFSRYGEKGIKVCSRWRRSFAAFFADMGPRPSLKHSIDRYPKTDGNYDPDNCRWATSKQQAQNRRNTRIVEFRGQQKCVEDWAVETGIKPGTLWNRIFHLGWSPERALQA